MTSSFPIASTIILIFGVQSIVLIILLLRKGQVKQSNIFLAMVLFFYALMSVNLSLVNFLVTYNKFYYFSYFQLELLFGIGPALYFFSQSITDSDYHFSRKESIHFLPVILEFIYFQTKVYRNGLYARIKIYETGSYDVYQTPMDPYTVFYLILQWLSIVSILVYIVLSVRILIRHNKWIKSNYSNLRNKSLGWLQIPVFIYSGFFAIWTPLRAVDTFFYQGTLREFYLLPTFLGISIVTCWIGFKGYIKVQTEAHGFSKMSKKREPVKTNPNDAKRIETLMVKSKPYLDSELDLNKLSKLVQLNPKITSSIINNDLKTNFYEFVNKHRVEEFKRLLQKEDRDKITLIAHAYESGFNSKSTFNHVFKKFTKQTPGEYYRQIKNKSERKHSDCKDKD